ncbi:MAG: type I glyceraldehyde-3-phosphate dehydrogenase [Candidatus Marinimicrobia bacterium]|jgi:glyceraldehyde 3-phosphate dehydrogenase|nr:type I glyceraldehyde-3-phosphate dehydrogenase [Candidatus Neomarinimicrobiota bacterium]MBT3936468.1 type I glyceraldehyde-3-phosphate dehydrogenase [Candidatus Neomarinimicrobiota bacterium]MBT3962433.1 type I glyceraldehyde-3-phosphate dehydrogenase [Candidatus Neomarinimicrobiota bacterium]MBT4383858.1 type I glyceraldehyde-3-phosphate dehydrogenase [Candidatus Neomarinimicrobiota bacterium]MBT4636365.1 type I glyceraldehyde-3-phosphate dehydrogenase [Candidatus Neomarinimicrobiota bact
MKPINIAIFGFGRIGRNLFRQGYKNPNFNFVAISDLGPAESLHYLLSRDSIHGPIDNEVILEGHYLVANGQKIRILPGGEPGQIPWDSLDVDVVIDATGKYKDVADLNKHIEAGAKRVIVTVPPENEVDRIVVLGINNSDIALSDKIISTTSSTTQVLALMLKMLDDKFGVKRAMMTTVHAYTSDQPLADTAQSDLRRSRSAVENIIPNKTWAPELVGKLMPQFEGKVEGTAFNVPVPDGSAVDLTTDLENLPSVEEANEAIQTFADGALNGIVGFTDDPIVSSDVIGRSETMLYDAKATMITANKLLKTVCWYDNGWGFSARILELIESYQTLENEGGES